MKTLTLSPKGLYTNPNTLSEVPQGALSIASNVTVIRPGILSSRRGLAQYGSALTAATKLFDYDGTALVWDNGSLKYDTAGTWSAGQTLAYPATNYRPKAMTANGNFYITSSVGVRKLTSPSATLSTAGVPKALDLTGSTTGSSGFLSNGNQCVYRVLFGTRDANNNLLLGAPSAPFTLSNSSGGSRDASMTFTLPTGLTTSHFYRLYRSAQATTALDEEYLSLEVVITSGDLSTGTITVTDSTLDAQLSVNLYTNETQEGILQANNPPPYARDVAWFANHAWYLNVREKHQSLIKIVVNPAVNDTITINNVVYTAKAAETIASGEFNQSSTIDTTARSLERVINRYASNTAVYAYYLGEGQLLIERRDFTDTAFSITASASTKWNLQATSANNARPGRIFASKPGEPEAVPALNFYDIGNADRDGVRAVPVEDGLYLFKDDGVFRITGNAFDNFTVEEHAATIRIRGDENAVRFESVVLVATNQGVVVVSSGGYQRISEAIDNDILPALVLSNIAQASFCCSYDVERLFIMGLPEDDTDTAPSQWYVFSGETREWSLWDRQDIHALVIGDVLYSVKPTQAFKERKTLSRLDFADEEYAVTITSVSGTSVVVASAANLAVGQTLKQGDVEGLIDEISGTTLTMDASYNFAAGAATAYVPIRCEVQFVEQDGGDPTKMKHFLETCGVFEDAAFAEIEFSWGTNLTSSYVATVIRGRTNAPWGRFAWGRYAWGGRYTGKQAFRTYVPRRASRALWLFPRIILEQAFNSFSFSGFSVKFNAMSENFRSR